MDTGSPGIEQILYSRHLPAARRGTAAHSPPSWSAHGYAFDDTAFSHPPRTQKAEMQVRTASPLVVNPVYEKSAVP